MKKFSFKKILALTLTLGMVLSLVHASPINRAKADAGDEPAHTKTVTSNGDGTYTIELTVTGESETIVPKINVIVIMDRSGSMGDPATRLSGAKTAINTLAQGLLSKNTSEYADQVEMALVTFSTTATITQNPTNNYNTFSGAVNRVTANGGTNWEAAFTTAGTVDFNDDDPTYVVFVSDGLPTFRVSPNGYTRDYYQPGVYGDGQEGNANVERCYNAAVPAAKALVDAGMHMYTIFAYGGNAGAQRLQSLTTEAGESADHYYSAADTNELNAAINTIMGEISQAGFGGVEIDDGTTSEVATSSGVANLLVVDESSYKYYRNNTEWKSTDDPAPPAAELKNGHVEWDLKDLGLLENGVTYKVTFRVYPSEETLNLIADLKNGKQNYDDLDENIKKYLKKDGNSYTLLTNTTATLTYTDTRTDDGEQTVGYVNPDPVATEASQINIEKRWVGTYNNEEAKDLTMQVYRGDEKYADIPLTYDSATQTTKGSWYIPIGLMTVDKTAGTTEILIKGSDYVLREPENLSYHWELMADIVHPMLINNVLTMLIKVDDADKPSGMTGAYYSDGTDEYYDIDGTIYKAGDSGASAALTATNYRRSNLNLTKVVDGENAPEDAEFTFTLKMKTYPTFLDPNGESLWFSVYDPVNDENVDALVSGAEKEQGADGWTGYYYTPAGGGTVVVKMRAGWNLRFTNVLTGTEFDIEETDVPEGFHFVSVAVDPEDDDPAPEISGKNISGTIIQTNEGYTVTYTNEYPTKDVTVEKVWEDEDDNAGLRPTSIEVQLLQNGDAYGDPVVLSEDTKWKYTWEDLPVYSGEEVAEYSVKEIEVDGYEVEMGGSEDEGFVITNTLVTGKLSISKTVTSDLSEDKTREYEFTITTSDPSIKGDYKATIGTTEQTVSFDDEGKATVKLTNGQTILIEGLPAGVTYKVAEAKVDGMDTEAEGAEGTIPEGGTAEAKFTNTRRTGSLVVTKVVDSPAAEDADKEFSVTVTLGDNTISGTYGDMSFSSGVATFKIKAGEDNAVTATGLPVGVSYTVSEETPANFEEPKIEGETGSIPDSEEPAKATITNARTLGELKVTKEVVSTTTTDYTKDFTFTAEIDVVDGTYGDVTFSNGKATFTLKDGESVTISGLPVGLECKVTEAEAEGFATTPKAEQTATVSEDGEEITFTNTKSEGSLIVSKVVESDVAADKTAKYAIKITLDDTTINGTYGDATFTNGVATVELADSESATISGLPEGVGYTVSEETPENFEDPEIEGATGKIVKDMTAAATVTNTRKTGGLKVEKKVESDLAADKTVKFSFTVKLGEEITGTFGDVDFSKGEATFTLADGESVSITGLPIGVSYEVTEEENANFLTVSDPNPAKGDIAEESKTVTFTNTRKTGDLTVKKVVESKLAADSTAEFKFTVTLSEKLTGKYGNMEFTDGVATFTLKDGQSMSAEGLPTNITYEVEEEAVELMATTSEGEKGEITEETAEATFTNTRDTYDLKVKKVVDSPAESDSTKAYSVKITLSDTNISGTFGDITFTNGVAEFTLKGGETKTAEGLPATVEYTVEETSPGEEYTVTYEGESGTLEADAEVTITNTRKLGKVTVTKKVESTTATDHEKEFEFTITLGDTTVNGTFDGVEFKDGVATITLKDGESITITGLPLGVTYTVEETADEAFVTTTNGKEDGSITEDGEEAIFTNTRNEGGLVVAKTVVSDLDADNDAAYTIKVTLSDKTLSGTYGDASFTNGVATLKLKNGETANITGLPEGVTYTVEEEEPEGFEVSYEGETGKIEKDKTASATVTNTRETGSLTVSKTVDSPLDSDKELSFEFTITLSEKLNATYSDVVFTDGVATITLKDGESKTIEGIPTTVDYTVEEKEATGFDTTSEGEEGTITTEESEAAFTNTSIRTEITVTKTWVDSNDQDGKRPDSITVTLYADGEALRSEELNEENGWKFTFTGLPEYNDGEKIEYTVDENDVEYYTKSIDGLEITNTHTVEKVKVTVTKVWNDDGDEAGLRPDHITVQLLANGTAIGSAVELKEDNYWSVTWAYLDKYEDGVAIEYSVTEVEVPAYVSELASSKDADGNFTLTLNNTLVTPAEDDPPVLKELVGDKPEQDEEFTFQLKAISNTLGLSLAEMPMPEGESESMTVKAKAGEEIEFGILTFWLAGTYVYEISEVNDGIPNYSYDDTVYTVTYNVTQSGTEMQCERIVSVDGEEVEIAKFEFKNEYHIPPIEIEVTKVWKDEVDAEHTRPESITVKLLADGEDSGLTLTLSEDNEWKGSFTDLPVQKDGEEITYTVEEVEDIEFYESEVTGDVESGFVITNTCYYEPTGDPTNLLPWISSMVLSAAGAGFVGFRKKREDEE